MGGLENAKAIDAFVPKNDEEALCKDAAYRLGFYPGIPASAHDETIELLKRFIEKDDCFRKAYLVSKKGKVVDGQEPVSDDELNRMEDEARELAFQIMDETSWAL